MFDQFYVKLCHRDNIMLRKVVMACRNGCKYKGEGCVKPPAVVRSQAYQAGLERCVRANRQEIEEPLLVEIDGRLEEPQSLEQRSDNRMNSIARRGDCRA
jgi:hypothetical protein